MSTAELDGILRPLAEAQVDLMAIEWDFPRFDLFPLDLDLQFFTAFRDPVERQLSGFAHDVIRSYTSAQSLGEYLGSTGIWTHPNYYTRFFSGSEAGDAVDEGTVDYVLEVLLSHFKFSFIQEDLDGFLIKEVGLPIAGLGWDNRTSVVGKVINRKRLHITQQDREELRAAHALDYRLLAALKKGLSRRVAAPADSRQDGVAATGLLRKARL